MSSMPNPPSPPKPPELTEEEKREAEKKRLFEEDLKKAQEELKKDSLGDVFVRSS
jgi:hypothetical protein